MSARIVNVYRSSNGQLIEHTSSAVFFGELKNELRLDPTKETITVRETKVDLVLDQAQLPEGEFTIFVAPKKVKSGGSTPDYASMSYNDLRKMAKDRNVTLPANAKKPDVIEALKNADSEKVKGSEGVAKAEKKVGQRKSQVATKVLETMEGFSEEDRKLLVQLSRNIHVVTEKLNMLLEEAGFERIPEDSTFMKDLPADQKPNNELTEAEKKAKEEAAKKAELEAKKKALANEASMLGL